MTTGMGEVTVILTTWTKGNHNLVGPGATPLDVCDQRNLLICSLTDKHRNAIRMVRKIKYFVARRKFQQVAGCLGMVGSVITLLPCVRLVSRMTCVM